MGLFLLYRLHYSEKMEVGCKEYSVLRTFQRFLNLRKLKLLLLVCI